MEVSSWKGLRWFFFEQFGPWLFYGGLISPKQANLSSEWGGRTRGTSAARPIFHNQCHGLCGSRLACCPTRADGTGGRRGMTWDEEVIGPPIASYAGELCF